LQEKECAFSEEGWQLAAMTISIPQAEQLFLFAEGSLYHSYRMLGAHVVNESTRSCVRFAVWAPNAASVRIVGDFNSWDGSRHEMELLGSSGVWHLVVPEAQECDHYKYQIRTRDGRTLHKAIRTLFSPNSSPRPHRAFLICPATRGRTKNGSGAMQANRCTTGRSTYMKIRLPLALFFNRKTERTRLRLRAQVLVFCA
jgi:1,4-alpha-glucan branching enzyme